MKHNCRQCVFYHWFRDEKDQYVYRRCDAQPQMANLNSFPFQQTTCGYFAPVPLELLTAKGILKL